MNPMNNIRELLMKCEGQNKNLKDNNKKLETKIKKLDKNLSNLMDENVDLENNNVDLIDAIYKFCKLCPTRGQNDCEICFLNSCAVKFNLWSNY